MQAQMTSAQWLRNRSALKPLPTTLIDFAVWVRNAHLISLPLMLVAPITLAPIFDGNVIPPFAVPWIRVFLTPIYDYYSQLVQFQAASFLIMRATVFVLRSLASRELHWSIHKLAVLIAGLGGLSLLTVFAPYTLSVLLVVPTLLLWLAVLIVGLVTALGALVIVGGGAILTAGVVLSLGATFIILSALASNRGHQDDDYRYQQHLQRQPHFYRRNSERYQQRAQEYYQSDE